MNVEIQANQCREDKVHFFPVQDFSVQLAVLAKKTKKKRVLFSHSNPPSGTALPPFPAVISVASRNNTITNDVHDPEAVMHCLKGF